MRVDSKLLLEVISHSDTMGNAVEVLKVVSSI